VLHVRAWRSGIEARRRPTVTQIEIPTFEDFVDLMRERMFDADALFPSRVHSFKDDLLPDLVGVVPDTWWEDAREELEAQGHLGVDGSGFGAPAARLSADGRLYIREQRAE
jgi:hypothetical protein